jgi:hypothetical protein
MSTKAQGVFVQGRITTTVYDVNQIRDKLPEWDDYEALSWLLGEDFREKLEPLDAARIEALESFVPRKQVNVTFNTTVDGLHKYIVDEIDSTQSPSDLDASHIAVGTDDSSESPSDSSLGNEVHREGVDSSDDNGKNVKVQTLIGENEANGNTLREVGIFTASSGGTMFNRAVISDISKTSNKTVTIEIELQFRSG